MNLPRASGVLLHVTSLPSPFGIGDLGPVAYRFVDFLVAAGQRWWQVLPLVPTAVGNSPYTSYSAFAGNPLLISPEQLRADGWLSTADLKGTTLETTAADFSTARQLRRGWFRQAFAQLPGRTEVSGQLEQFRAEHQWWLDDYALFTALGMRLENGGWNSWDRELVQRDANTLQRARRELADEIQYVEFVQFLFWQQWQQLKTYANSRGLKIFGDIPIFVAHESADVWQHQHLFLLDEAGRRTVVAGVPPDYFSADGQLWGNPLYRWDVMAAENYRWWVDRLRHSLRLFDLIRIDHFRGFEANWEVAADAPNAIHGRWAKGPGAPFFRIVERELGPLPLVAEDLGLITDEVTALRDELGLPGMRVFQFGFDDDWLGQFHRPHSYPENCVAYSGTHDNNTTLGWYNEIRQDVRGDRVRVYLSSNGHSMPWDVIRSVLSSAARTVVFPLQDLLGLDADARMNVPGVSAGNWGWRFREELLTSDLAARLAELTRDARR